MGRGDSRQGTGHSCKEYSIGDAKEKGEYHILDEIYKNTSHIGPIPLTAQQNLDYNKLSALTRVSKL